MKRQIYIMRHAEPHNPSGVMYGTLPGFNLSEKGKKQAREASEFFASQSLDIIIVSKLERSQETGKIVANSHPSHPQIIIDSRIHDIGIGPSALGEMTIDEWMANRDEILKKRLAGVNGFERPIDCQKRMLEAFWDNLKRYPDKNILFVSHGDPIWFLALGLADKEFDLTKPYSSGGKWDIKKAEVLEITLEPKIEIVTVFEPTIE